MVTETLYPGNPDLLGFTHIRNCGVCDEHDAQETEYCAGIVSPEVDCEMRKQLSHIDVKLVAALPPQPHDQRHGLHASLCSRKGALALLVVSLLTLRPPSPTR